VQAPPHGAASLSSASVSLPRAVEAVRATLELAAHRGIGQASIQLSPESLGGLHIQLRQTTTGLVARIVADHADAAQTLTQGGDELRRSLQEAGIPLARLDIEASGQQSASNPDAGAGAGAGAGGRREQHGADRQDGEAADATPLDGTRPRPAAAGLVNVLA